MAGGSLSDNIRRFLAGNIPSVPHLEALLLLREASTSGLCAWSPAAVAARLYLPELAVQPMLGELTESGLLAQSDEIPAHFGYFPRTPALADVVTEVADAYASQLIEVTRIIHSRPGRKAQQFADAFRWRKE